MLFAFYTDMECVRGLRDGMFHQDTRAARTVAQPQHRTVDVQVDVGGVFHKVMVVSRAVKVANAVG